MRLVTIIVQWPDGTEDRLSRVCEENPAVGTEVSEDLSVPESREENNLGVSEVEGCDGENCLCHLTDGAGDDSPEIVI